MITRYEDTLPELFKKSEFSKKREHIEFHETVRCADWLRGEIHNGKNVIRVQVPFPGLEFTHFPAEGADGKEGFFAKRMGVRSGVHDFLFWWGPPANSAFIELKVEGKAPRKGQRDFDDRLRAMGFTNRAVCYTTEAVRDNLILWGATYKPVSIPPRRLTNSEKLAMQWEIGRP